jgi:hypothetical protein
MFILDECFLECPHCRALGFSHAAWPLAQFSLYLRRRRAFLAIAAAYRRPALMRASGRMRTSGPRNDFDRLAAQNHAQRKSPTPRRGLELRGIPLWKVMVT